MALALVHAQGTYRGLDDRNTNPTEDPYGNQFDTSSNTFNPNKQKGEKHEKKEIPKGMYVWTVDPLFGDRIPVEKDTLQHLFMNTVFTSGMHGEYQECMESTTRQETLVLLVKIVSSWIVSIYRHSCLLMHMISSSHLLGTFVSPIRSHRLQVLTSILVVTVPTVRTILRCCSHQM